MIQSFFFVCPIPAFPNSRLRPLFKINSDRNSDHTSVTRPCILSWRRRSSDHSLRSGEGNSDHGLSFAGIGGRGGVSTIRSCAGKTKANQIFESQHDKACSANSLSGPVLRDTARLSQRHPSVARYGGFLASQYGQFGAIPPPPFLSISPRS